MNTPHNLGHHERVIRVGLGLLLLALSAFSLFPVWGNLALLVVGLIVVLTGLIGYCPVWHLTGIHTCQSPASDHPSYPPPTVDERANTTPKRP